MEAQMNRTHKLAAGLTLFLALLLPNAAQANTYTVEGCGSVGTGALQFSANPATAFDLTTSSCTPTAATPEEDMGLNVGQAYDQGALASWSLQAPSGESVVGLAYRGGWYAGQGGWLAGWILNGDVAQNAVPADDDCMEYEAGGCSETGAGTFVVNAAGSIAEVLECDAAAAGATQCPAADGVSFFGVSDAADAVVELDDSGDAAPVVSGTLWSAANGQGLNSGWLSGLNAGAALSLGFQASDPGGVCTLRAALTDSTGTVVASNEPVADTPSLDASSTAAADYSLAAPLAPRNPVGGRRRRRRHSLPTLLRSRPAPIT